MYNWVDAVRDEANFDITLKGVMRNDYRFILSVVDYAGDNYHHISEDFKYDVDMILTCLYPTIHSSIPEESLSIKDIVIKILDKGRSIFIDLPIFWRRDYDVAMTAVKINGCYLKDVIGEAKNDRNIIKSALGQNKMAWCYVSDRMRKDEEILDFLSKL